MPERGFYCPQRLADDPERDLPLECAVCGMLDKERLPVRKQMGLVGKDRRIRLLRRLG